MKLINYKHHSKWKWLLVLAFTLSKRSRASLRKIISSFSSAHLKIGLHGNMILHRIYSLVWWLIWIVKIISVSNTWTVNLQLFKLVLEKAEEPEIKLPTSAASLKKQESSRKTSISALLTMPKPLTVWITTNCGKFWKRWEYQSTWPASWETYMQVRKQQLKLDMEQQAGSK